MTTSERSHLFVDGKPTETHCLPLSRKTGWSKVAVNGTIKTPNGDVLVQFPRKFSQRRIQAVRPGTSSKEQMECTFFVWTFRYGNFGLPFKKSLFLRKFTISKHQISLSIYIPTEISGFFWEMVNSPYLNPKRKRFTVHLWACSFALWFSDFCQVTETKSCVWLQTLRFNFEFFVRSRCPVWYEVWIETVGDGMGGRGGGGGGERGLKGRDTGLIVERWPLFAPCKQRFLGLPVPAGE